jgi:superfamily I DNA and/or RNA helicase
VPFVVFSGYVPREGERVSFNRNFLLAYAHFNNAKINDEFIEKSFEDFEKESLPFRNSLYEFLKNSPLILNFNQELFTDKLINFEKLLKSDLDLNEKIGELKLYQQAVLGIFPQAGSFLVPDYEFLIEEDEAAKIEGDDSFEAGDESSENPIHKLNKLFATKAKVLHIDSIKEEKILAPFAMDASQEYAIKMVNAGHSIVIQGPPGTGKSQLICNLIADFAAAGKRVLVVCQKRAALDVVFQRLSKVGFNNFAALVHDFKNDRKSLFNQIANQIALVDEYKKQNHSLDAIKLEDDFNQTSRQIDRLAAELDSFKSALFDTSECGISIKDLYLSSNPSAFTIDLANEYKYFKNDEILAFTAQLKAFGSYSNQLSILSDFWQNRVDFKNFQISDLNQAKKTIREITLSSVKLKNFFTEKLDINATYSLVNKLVNDTVAIKSVIEIAKNQNIWEEAKYIYSLKNYKGVIKNFANLKESLLSVFDHFGPEKTLQSYELDQILAMVSEAKLAKSNFVSNTIYSLFSKQKSPLASVLSKNGLQLTAQDLEILQQRIQNRKKLQQWFLENAPLLKNIDENTLLTKDKNWVEAQFETIGYACELLKQIENIKSLDLKSYFERNISELKSNLKIGLEQAEAFKIDETNGLKYFTISQIDFLFANNGEVENLTKELEDNFDLLYESDNLKAKFSHTEWAVVEKLYKSDKRAKANKIVEDFNNSIKLAWISDIEEKHPILRSVSSLKMAQLEQELQEKILHKQNLSQQILLIKSREHTYNNLEMNRLKNVTTYRELLHQVTKKKKIWSIRQLVGSYSEEIFDLVPCWLASPETVSAVFPMQRFFDLVIFDEASQCYAESGLPAIFRGKQCVVTGDSKQLQPSDLYQMRYEDDADEQPELEVDSLLDLAIQHLHQIWLHGHYRSHSIDLIDFSNRYFYKEKLQLLPHFDEINKKEPGIKFIKVDGVFEASTNALEAAEVVKLVKSLNKTDPSKSIGIVTFNYKQQNLIQDLLEGISLVDQDIENTFVKNIENVQGDERDIIIFSIGYGKDSKGKIKMAFGSLNLAGGENRLNVAITRARNQIFVVSSILPQELNVDDTLNEGPKLLKKYMEYAQSVSEGKYVPRPFVGENLPTGGLLKDLLKNSNINLSNELPFADLVEKNENGYGELKLTDDDLFYQSLSAKENHAYWPINFNKKGWVFTKSYSREYWKSQK